jgi:hypothetical protein
MIFKKDICYLGYVIRPFMLTSDVQAFFILKDKVVQNLNGCLHNMNPHFNCIQSAKDFIDDILENKELW